MARAQTRPFYLPYEPEYTEHRTSQPQVQNARMLFHVHMNLLQAQSIAADECPDAENRCVRRPALHDTASGIWIIPRALGGDGGYTEKI